jgi:hypothetical protein
MLSECRTMWGLNGGWKETDKIRSKFGKIILGAPRFAANDVIELQLGMDSRRGKFLSTNSKFWLRFFMHRFSVNSKNVLWMADK